MSHSLTRGQRYRGPGGEVWWVIDPDMPGHIDHTGVRIEHNTVPDTDQQRAGVWIENMDGEGYWFEKDQYRSLIAGGDFERVEGGR